jgi:hypothetical protein
LRRIDVSIRVMADELGAFDLLVSYLGVDEVQQRAAR